MLTRRIDRTGLSVGIGTQRDLGGRYDTELAGSRCQFELFGVGCARRILLLRFVIALQRIVVDALWGHDLVLDAKRRCCRRVTEQTARKCRQRGETRCRGKIFHDRTCVGIGDQ